MFLEVAQQPAGRDTRMPVRFLLRDRQRQLERFAETDPADLLRGRLGDKQVVVLDGSLEDGARMALRGRRRSSPGPDGEPSLGRSKRSWEEDVRAPV
jgi:hypothetical protein